MSVLLINKVPSIDFTKRRPHLHCYWTLIYSETNPKQIISFVNNFIICPSRCLLSFPLFFIYMFSNYIHLFREHVPWYVRGFRWQCLLPRGLRYQTQVIKLGSNTFIQRAMSQTLPLFLISSYLSQQKLNINPLILSNIT